MKTLSTLRLSAVAGLAIFAFSATSLGSAEAKAVACNLNCAKSVFSKPNSFAASLLVSEAMMARSVVKYCPGTQIVASRKPTYDLALANSRKVLGFFEAGKMQRYADKRAKQSIELYGGCKGMKRVFDASFARWLLGWK